MKISIVTINYNNRLGLKRTIESVLTQSWKDFEYIIIDGKSNDGSEEIIRQHEKEIAYWVSEKDSGIYHAMNKGIKRASGEYLLFLNSGDEFFSSTVLEDQNERINSEDLIYFDILVKDNDKEFVKTYPEKLSINYLFRDTLPHPATFIKRTLFEKIGLYDESLVIVSDWKFFISAVLKFNCTSKYVHSVLSVFYLDGISSNVENKALIKAEKTAIFENEFSLIKEEADLSIQRRNQLDELKGKVNAFKKTYGYRILKKLNIVNGL
ncbi:MAG: glycosyltransferase family 2 protein [Bacteroidota bacterium]